MVGTSGNDFIYGNDVDFKLNDGDDIICGLADDDLIFGGFGEDEIFSGSGTDIIDGGPANDIIHGGSGDDAITIISDFGFMAHLVMTYFVVILVTTIYPVAREMINLTAA